jgi:hypothetical protein
MSAVIKPSSIIPPLRSSKPAVDINGFFEIVGQALQEYTATEGKPNGADPFYVEDFPKERLSQPDTAFNGITFHVLDGELAANRNDGTTVARAPFIRSTRSMPDQAGYVTVTNGWWENNTVQFEIWAKTNSMANVLAIWFHRFLMRYAYHYKFFEAYGVQQFKYLKRLEDSVEQKEEQEVYLRRLCYTFRLQYLDVFTERLLTDLQMNVSLGRDVQTLEFPTNHPAQ